MTGCKGEDDDLTGHRRVTASASARGWRSRRCAVCSLTARTDDIDFDTISHACDKLASEPTSIESTRQTSTVRGGVQVPRAFPTGWLVVGVFLIGCRGVRCSGASPKSAEPKASEDWAILVACANTVAVEKTIVHEASRCGEAPEVPQALLVVRGRLAGGSGRLLPSGRHGSALRATRGGVSVSVAIIVRRSVQSYTLSPEW